MELTDFQRRMLGFPAQMFGGAPSQPIPNQDVNTGTIAAPTADQLQQQDMQEAGMQRLGSLGMLLMAAGQRMTPRERATILAQAPQYMDGMQRDAASAAQARLINMQGQAAQQEIARTQNLQSKLSDPAFLQSLNITPEIAQALGHSGIQKLLENQAMANTPDNRLDRQVKEAQLKKLLTPEQEKPTLVDMPDGSKGMWYPGSTNVVPVEGTGQGPKPATQDQAASAGFVTRMRNANNVMSDPGIAEYGMGVKGTMNRANSSIPIIGNSYVDPQYQQLDQAQRNFINATLRRESGASISPGEFENARIQYFPQVGDSPEVIAQKELNRQDAIKGVLYATSPQFQKEFGDITPKRKELPEGVTSIRKVR
jgi:hypothetical protein